MDTITTQIALNAMLDIIWPLRFVAAGLHLKGGDHHDY